MAEQAFTCPEKHRMDSERGAELTLHRSCGRTNKCDPIGVNEGDNKKFYGFDGAILTKAHSPARCGIALAGGEGKRLQPFVDRLRGDGLPRQYMNFIGSRSMLEHTFQRAEKLISSDLLFTVVNRDHLRFPKSGGSFPAAHGVE